jgi:hypothetical protein
LRPVFWKLPSNLKIRDLESDMGKI